jgi:hypothetical protein
MSDPPLYAITVSGEEFYFTWDQLESDPGNYFMTYFLGREGRATKQLRMEKEPKLLQLIQAHLRGYDIFPIPDTIVPLYMTKETMVNNLLNEARLYGLRLLCEKILNYQEIQRRKELEKEASKRRRSSKFGVSGSHIYCRNLLTLPRDL